MAVKQHEGRWSSLAYYFNRLVSGTAALSMVNISEKMVAFLLLPVFTYYLSPREYGILAMANITLTFLCLLYNPGMMTAVVRKYYDTDVPEEKQIIVGSGLVFFLAVSLFFWAISVFSGDRLFPLIFDHFEFMPYGLLAVSASVMMMPTRLWSAVWIAHEKASIVAKWSLARMLISVMCSLLLVVHFKLGALGRLTGMMMGQLPLFIFSSIALLYYSKKRYSLTMNKRLLTFGAPLIFGVWAYTILGMVDRYVLERMMGLDAVGIYDVGYKFGTLPMIIASGFKRVWPPVFYENMNDGNLNVLSILNSYYILGLATFCGALVLFSTELMHFMVNPRFYQALSVVPWVACGICFLGLLVIPESVFVYENRLGAVSCISAGCALVNLLLNFLLIPVFGVTGAALATFLAYLGYLIAASVSVKQRLAQLLEGKRAFIPIVFLFFCLVISCLTSSIRPASTLILTFIKTMLMLAWPVGLFLSGYFTPQEIGKVRGLMKRWGRFGYEKA